MQVQCMTHDHSALGLYAYRFAPCRLDVVYAIRGYRMTEPTNNVCLNIGDESRVALVSPYRDRSIRGPHLGEGANGARYYSGGNVINNVFINGCHVRFHSGAGRTSFHCAANDYDGFHSGRLRPSVDRGPTTGLYQ